MGFGKISSLGLGSNVLTQDIIDKLKSADRAGIINPITQNMEKNVTKQKDLSAIKTLISSFKLSVSALSDETMFLKRSVNTNGKSADLSVSSGVGLQDIDIDVKQLAARDIYQSKKFISPESFAAREGSFVIKFNNVDYKIDLKQSTSYEELAAKITDATSGYVQAKILKVGGDKPYQLILQSKDTGASNKIEFSTQDSSGNELDNANYILEALGWDSANVNSNKISTAQDSEFTYNGIMVKRDSNNIKDLSIGLNLTLKEVGKTTFSVKEDTSDIKKEIENLVKTYNSLVNTLDIATDYNSDTNNAGTFQGINEITSIKSTINRLLFTTKTIGEQDNISMRSMHDSGSFSVAIKSKSNNLNITDFGITLTKDGLLELNSLKLNSKLSENLDDAKKLFAKSSMYSTIQTASSKAINSGAISVSNDDFIINGNKITLTTPSTNTSKENALALLKAINEASIVGIQATLNKAEDRIVLKSTDGTAINIQGKADVLESFGLSAMNLTSKETRTDGVFSSLNLKLDNIVGKNGTLTIYNQNLIEEKKKLEKDRLKATQDLDTKYDMMAQRFLAYDNMINKLQNQFSTLQSMIDAELKSKK